MLTGREVAALAAKACGMTLREILDGEQSRDACRARSAATWVLRQRWEDAPSGWGAIAKLIGVCDAAAASYCYSRAIRLRDSDRIFRAATDRALERAQEP